jgi:topoisomerase-4 subunit B
MAAIQYLAPDFIKEGRLCWLRSPLYIVKDKKKETYYFTDDDFNKVRATITGEVQRNKGLGSLSPAQAHNSMFTKEYQKLDVLQADEKSIKLLYALMGEDVTPRKEYVFSKIDFSQIRE